MKPILQSEASECGIACLAMVANHHGAGLDMREMRRRFPLSLKGANLTRLMHVAQALGFESRPLRLELDQLHRLKVPCILHWDLAHFVVLVKAGRRRLRIIDPSFGSREVSLAEVSNHFTGIALELTPSPSFESKPEPRAVSLGQLTGPVHGLRRSLAMILLLSLSLQVFVVLSPFFLQWVIDQVLVSSDDGLLVLLGIGFTLLILIQVTTALLRGWTVIYLSAQLSLQWMGSVFAHLLRLPLDFLARRHLGDVVSRMDSVRSIQNTLTTSFIEAVIDGLMAVVTLLMMLLYSWKLALVSLLAMVLYFALRLFMFRRLRSATEQQLVTTAQQQSHLLESIRGMQSLKLAGNETSRGARYQNLTAEAVNSDASVARLNLGFNTVNQLIFNLERIVVIWVGAVLVMRSLFSVGMLIAYLAFREQFAQRMSGFVDKLLEFRMLRLHGERLADIVLTPPEVDPISKHEQQPPRKPRIELRDISFRYAEGEPWVVDRCSLIVEPGESVAITGASGCGKTTLIKLILGLIEPTRGVIEIGGVDLRQLGARNFRAVVGAVMQDDQLFAGSIAENIAFGDDSVDLERVEHAARLAAVHEDIAAMPMGYHGLIGDMGTTLSGGQKQRVILARALYRHPCVLVLDEATSHLDLGRERRVNEAIRQLQMTRIIVAHRPETIASADRTVRMETGRIVESTPAGVSKDSQQMDQTVRTHEVAA